MCPYYLSLFSLFLNFQRIPLKLCYVLAMFNIYMITRITSNSAYNCISKNNVLIFDCALQLYVNNANKIDKKGEILSYHTNLHQIEIYV